MKRSNLVIALLITGFIYLSSPGSASADGPGDGSLPLCPPDLFFDTTQDCKLVETELYDLGLLGAETRNVVADPAYEEALRACARLSAHGYPPRRRASSKNLKGKKK